jgi:hypothetical protein
MEFTKLKAKSTIKFGTQTVATPIEKEKQEFSLAPAAPEQKQTNDVDI